ncbi:MAG: pentapeptide repeat-containing protein, partial [Spirulinaceae cyanobacterium]
GANLNSAFLTNACMNNSDLDGVNFANAIIYDADVTGASMENLNIADAQILDTGIQVGGESGSLGEYATCAPQ